MDCLLYTSCGKKDEMILTTFAGMKKDIEAQQEVIRQLAKNEVAAVVVFQMESSSGENQSYPDVMRAAEEAALPLIILIGSRDIGYSRVITEVMEKVLYGSNFNNSLINNTIFHLLNFEKHSNFQQALREAAINNDFQVVLMSEEFNPCLLYTSGPKVLAGKIVLEARNRYLSRELDDLTAVVIKVE